LQICFPTLSCLITSLNSILWGTKVLNSEVQFICLLVAYVLGNISLRNLHYEDLNLLLFGKTFIILDFTLIHFELIFVCVLRVQVHSFVHKHPILPVALVEKTILSLRIVLSEISWTQVHGFISGLSIIRCWSVCHPYRQYPTVLTTLAL
jgi:hypothetical protein